MRKNEIIVLFIAVVILIGGFFAFAHYDILDWSRKIDTAQAMEIMIFFVLVLVTAMYAKRTSDVADATKQQADASLKMAKEMKEQRYSECLPVLLVSIAQKTKGLDPDEHLYRILQTGTGATFEWANSGKGVAINARFSLWGLPLDSHPGKVLFFPPRESKALEVDAHVRIDFDYSGEWFDQPAAYCPRLEAEYQDIYERHITTVQEFRINAQDKTASLGELYFTINGRRLGSEKT